MARKGPIFRLVEKLLSPSRKTTRQFLPKGPLGLPDWAAAIASDAESWSEAKERAAQVPTAKILMATMVGGHGPATVIESTLAAALTMRGAEVQVLLCDQALPACLRAEIAEIPDPSVIETYRLANVVCSSCQMRGSSAYEGLKLPIHWIGRLVTEEQAEQARQMASSLPADAIRGHTLEGIAVGEHAYAGALRYFARGDLEDEPKGEVVLRRYLESAILTQFAIIRLIDEQSFDAACFHHGLYIPQGVIGEVCRARGIRVINWCVSYRAKTLIFSHEDTYHHTLLNEPISAWSDFRFGKEEELEIVKYLKSRWGGARDWIYFHENPSEDFAAYANEVGIDLTKPCIGLLTNVMWDAQLHYRANAFPNMLDWVLQTIDYFVQRPDLQLIIRVHPAEIRGTAPSRQPLLAEIEKAWPNLPANIHVIGPEVNISTYSAMEHCDSAIIYGTKMGVELSSVGIPVIVAGEAWIRNKGLTRDASSPMEYFDILDELPFGERLDTDATRRARKYAYHFFFRRMIPLPFVVPAPGPAGFELEIGGVGDLAGGIWPGLDVISDGILKAKPFVYKAESLGLHDAENH